MKKGKPGVDVYLVMFWTKPDSGVNFLTDCKCDLTKFSNKIHIWLSKMPKITIRFVFYFL